MNHAPERAERPLFLRGEPTPARVPRPSAPPRAAAGRIPGEPGLWVFVLGDMTLFGVFFVAYVAALDRQPALFAAGAAALDRWSGLLNTTILLASSFCVAGALAAGRAGRTGTARRFFGLTAVLGLAFAVVKLAEYRHLAGLGFAPVTDLYFTYYFVLTGIHLTHVLIGLALILACLRGCGRPGFAASRFPEGAGVYWHMVDALWMVLFPLLYLVPAV
ncbi:cytochrome c oxidase subunit 3 [Nocardia harenae]|uniref:cytochrome c oxidase subunit 3 n=1 Tax=Nocardia harenae TaxID=358707 RepID=UPI0008300781|nr:cytochrome c oxidase subunit 3 [Nocardia harenae]